MFFANLSALEFFALLGGVSAVTVALYLLIRMRRRQRVSTLRFWQPAERQEEPARKRRIDQPWSLLLQLISLALLLLAIAQPRFGRPAVGRDHVLLLDTSAWTGLRQGGRTISAEAKRLAIDWLNRTPAEDRVMVVRTDALTTPATRFEPSRETIAAAIRGVQPSATALDLERALDFATQALRMEGRQAGEIVYVGPGSINGPSQPSNIPPNLRVLETQIEQTNAGFTRASLRRSSGDPQLWQVFLTIRNYGRAPRPARLVAGIGGALINVQTAALPAAGEAEVRFGFRTSGAGLFEARIEGQDGLAADDRVTLELPQLKKLRVQVYSSQPEVLRHLLASDPRVEATFAAPSAFDPKAKADLVITDSFTPAVAPETNWLSLNPPAPQQRRTADASLSRWNGAHPVGSGLQTHDLKLHEASVLNTEPGDTVIAESPKGPLVTAGVSPAGRKRVVVGFDLLNSPLRFELTTPLLFANVLRWVNPQMFLNEEIVATTPGAVTTELAEAADPGAVRVLDEQGVDVPHTMSGRTLRFFAAQPSSIRVAAPSFEQVFSLSLPGLGVLKWEPPPGIVRGLGGTVAGAGAPKDLWQWFALAGAVLLAVEWWLFGRRKHARLSKLGVALKLAALAAILIGLIHPDLSVQETKLAVAVLADTSASLPAADLEDASRIASSIDSARGRHLVRILPFARSTRGMDPSEFASGLKLRHTAGEAGRSTDLEAAVREAATALPAGLVPRLALISDGNETRGSLIRAAWQARQLGIPIDTFSLAGRPEPKLKLESARLPASAFTGEKFPIDLRVTSPGDADGHVELAAEGKILGSSPMKLGRGENNLHATASIATAGAIDLVSVVHAEGLGELRYEQAVSIRRPRLLYLSMDPPGMESHLFGMLAAAQIDAVSNVEFATARFDDYQIVLLNNWDLESMPAARKAELEKYVQQGGGLLIIGGERNIWVDKKGAPPDALARTLPATVAPPRSPEGATVVLIVDKSSSMEGRKIELARLAAIGVVENLKLIDHVGVLIFDNSHQWAVPIRRAEDRTLIKRLIAGITPDGGTQIAPALAEAYKRILPATGAYKHVVLLTDGISEEGDSMAIAKEAAQNRVTISTVGLGQDVNKAYLEKVAQFARGKAHFLTDPSGLEQILLKDVMEHTGSTTVERSFQPKVIRRAEIFGDLSLENAPALRGYVRFEAKPTAETLLAVAAGGAGEKDDPLLVRWQYGLGRAAVFTSDAKTRWAQAWVSWPGFDKFWMNLVRDLLPHAQPAQTTLEHDSANGLLTAGYRLNPSVEAPARPPKLYAIGPDGFQAAVPLERTGDRNFHGRVAIGGRTGMFRVRPLEESRLFPEVGLYLPEPELMTYGSNPRLLEQVSAYTGGRFNPAPREVFDASGRSVASTMKLWPGLMALGILLNLLEVTWRRLRGSGASFLNKSWLPRAA